MANLDELKTVVQDTLESRGKLNQVKAIIRAEVFNALNDSADLPPKLTNENMFINELIREYLLFNKYKHTEAVLQAESGQPQERLHRELLSEELGVREDPKTASVPLLYGVIAHFLARKDDQPGPAS